MESHVHDDSSAGDDELSRRRSIRRRVSERVQADARVADRRARKPGFSGLLSAMFGLRRRRENER